MKSVFLILAVFLQGTLFISASPAVKENPVQLHTDFIPNVDLKIQEEENYSRYEWHIKPGSSIADIHFKNKNAFPGDQGHWSYLQPTAFQVITGKHVPVEVEIIAVGEEMSFRAPNYNPGADLFIRGEMEKCYTNPVVDGFLGTGADGTFSGTTYYIRPDGGTAGQCTGTSDAPYPGSGTNQPCAWAHPFWALDGGGNWKIQGGDTIIIAEGSYKMGYGAPNTSWCDAEGAYGCVLPPLPSGPNSANPTRILGKGWNSGCSAPPELWGSQRPWQIIDLTGSSNVYIGCLEITDHSNCVEFHANGAVSCERDTYPYGDWASEGIIATDSANVTLKNLDIHGLASTGIRAGRISNWTVEDVRIAGNGWAGWDGDVEGDDSNSGTISFKRFTVEWNGCGETYPGGQPHNCWSQTAGGYGDGFGTGTTGGHWIFEDSIFRYNTSDGLDLLYARNSGSRIEIKRTMSYGNAGNAIKVNGPTSIENSLMIGNCGFFHGKSFTYNVDDCRALGSPLSFSLRKGATFSLVNSTIVGQGDCLMGGECDDNSCDGSETIIIQNNAFQGYADYLDPEDTTCYLWLEPFNLFDLRMDYNILYNVKIADQLTLSAHELQQKPMFVNDTLESFDGHLKSGSPAIDSGLAVGSLNGLIPNNDLENNSRPGGAGVDRGAYEYQSGGNTPSITVTSPNGGETWQAGSTHAVTWTSTGTVGNVKIQYSVNNGSTWTTIVSSTANDGSYSWTLPAVSSTQCLAKIAETDGSPSDTSNSVFSITTGSTQQPRISLSRTQLYYGAQGNTATDDQSFFVSNSGGGTLQWSSSADRSWLDCSPASGTETGLVTVSVKPSGLSPGTHSGNITISSTNASNSPRSVSVNLTLYTPGGNTSPFGSFDTPTQGSTVTSSIPVTGWALDDVQVANVKIYRQSNGNQVYIGDAVFVEGARPDVEQAYPGYPLNYKAGWGYMMLTNFLPDGGNGTFTLIAVAQDAEGNKTTLGSKTITCDNAHAVKPFGAIDTPTQGGTASGANFINWGWVLTPQPNRIPTNGATIHVYVDGVNLGHPKYNIYRSDIAALFSGYSNSGGAAGYFSLDTTAFDNGVHTLQWTATDDAGNTDGIGSRYFAVQNTAPDSMSEMPTTNTPNRPSIGQEAKFNGREQAFRFRKPISQILMNPGYFPEEPDEPIRVRTGYDEHTPPRLIYPDQSGIIAIETKELERIEIAFAGTREGNSSSPGCSGYLVVGNELRPLPIGSTLDSRRGRFYWQPGPGHLGEYFLVFFREEDAYRWHKTTVAITIVPKY